MRNFIPNSRDARKIAATGMALAAAGVSLTAAIRPASATPSGLINLPSTDIYDKGTIHLDVDYLRFSGFGTPVGRVGSSYALTSGLTYGIGPDTDKPFGRTEVGFDFIVAQTGNEPKFKQRVFFNAKTQLYNNDEQGVRVVIGGSSLGSKVSNALLGYITGSKNFGKAGRVHLGVARAFNDDNLAFSGPGVDRNLIQFGYERLITDQVHFIAEYGTGDSAFGNAGVSVIYYLDDKSDIQLGVLRPNQNGGPRTFYYVGYDRNFGKRAAAPPEPNPQGEARN